MNYYYQYYYSFIIGIDHFIPFKKNYGNGKRFFSSLEIQNSFFFFFLQPLDYPMRSTMTSSTCPWLRTTLPHWIYITLLTIHTHIQTNIILILNYQFNLTKAINFHHYSLSQQINKFYLENWTFFCWHKKKKKEIKHI